MEKAKKTSLHVAGGEHKGIVINKDVQAEGEEVIINITSSSHYHHHHRLHHHYHHHDNDEQVEPAHLCLEFRVFLVNASSGRHAQVTFIISIH